MGAWKDEQGLLALLIGLMLISVIVLAVLAFVPLDHFERSASRSIASPEDVGSVLFIVDVEVCDVEVQFQDMGGKAVQIDLVLEGRSGYLGSEPEVTFTVESSMGGRSLLVDVLLDMDTGPTVDYDDPKLTIIVHSALRASLDVLVAVGDITLEAARPVVLDQVTLCAEVGTVQADLGDGVVLHADLDLRSEVGSVELSCSSLIVDGELSLNLSAATGGLALDVEQTSLAGGNLTFNCATEVGTIGLDLIIAGGTAAEITSSIELGNVHTELDGFSGTDVHLVSGNFPDQCYMRFVLTTKVGSIDIDAQWRA
jgi:hypothetical protein